MELRELRTFRVVAETLSFTQAAVQLDYAQSSVTAQVRALEQELGKPVPHFSYPCPALEPHWTDHTVNMSRELGYLTSVTTNGGMVRAHDNALRLRRIRPTKTIDGLHWNLERTFSGAVV